MSFRKDQFARRWSEVESALNADGFYSLTAEELEFGARTAWRNAPR